MKQSYYQSQSIETIDIIEHYPFNIANALKYLFRLGKKPNVQPLIDIKKALYYVQRAIKHGDSSFYLSNTNHLMIAKHNTDIYLNNNEQPDTLDKLTYFLQQEIIGILTGLTRLENVSNNQHLSSYEISRLNDDLKDDFTRAILTLQLSEQMLLEMIDLQGGNAN